MVYEIRDQILRLLRELVCADAEDLANRVQGEIFPKELLQILEWMKQEDLIAIEAEYDRPEQTVWRLAP